MLGSFLGGSDTLEAGSWYGNGRDKILGFFVCKNKEQRGKEKRRRWQTGASVVAHEEAHVLEWGRMKASYHPPARQASRQEVTWPSTTRKARDTWRDKAGKDLQEEMMTSSLNLQGMTSSASLNLRMTKQSSIPYLTRHRIDPTIQKSSE